MQTFQPDTRYGKKMDYLLQGSLALLWILCWYWYSQMPEQISLDFAPKTDTPALVPKSTFLYLPLIPAVLALLLGLLIRNPQWYPIMVDINDQNQEYHYQLVKLFIRAIRIVLVIVFLVICWLIYRIAVTGPVQSAFTWFYGALSLMAIPIFTYLYWSNRPEGRA
jgi:hypothetical protein